MDQFFEPWDGFESPTIAASFALRMMFCAMYGVTTVEELSDDKRNIVRSGVRLAEIFDQHTLDEISNKIRLACDHLNPGGEIIAKAIFASCRAGQRERSGDYTGAWSDAAWSLAIMAVVQGMAQGKKYEAIEAPRRSGQHAAYERHRNSKYGHLKPSIKSEWDAWRKDCSLYKSKAAFCREMALKNSDVIRDPATVGRWIDEWSGRKRSRSSLSR